MCARIIEKQFIISLSSACLSSSLIRPVLTSLTIRIYLQLHRREIIGPEKQSEESSSNYQPIANTEAGDT